MFNSKSWYRSKTIWSGIVAVVIAAYNEAANQFGLPVTPDFVYALLGALGVYGRATANATVSRAAKTLGR